MINQLKTLQELNLLDRFLFSEVMVDNETLEDVLEIILGYPAPLKDKTQAEKELRRTPLNKSVYFDVYGEGKYKYTFRMSCDEISGLKLHDGATRIFLNTHGTDAEGTSEELIQLLHYFEQTTEENAAGSHSRKIEKLQRRVEQIKQNEEVGIRYMNAFEEKMWERREGREEGEKIGEERGKKQGETAKQQEIACKMLEMKMALDIISKATGLSEQELNALQKRS